MATAAKIKYKTSGRRSEMLMSNVWFRAGRIKCGHDREISGHCIYKIDVNLKMHHLDSLFGGGCIDL